MRFSLAVTTAFAVIISNGVNGWELRGSVSKEDRNLVDAQDYFVQIFSDKWASACIQAKGEGTDSKVILAGWESCTGFRVDENGLIRSFKEGGDLCLQAGRGTVLQDGTKMRCFPCNSTNELQQFSWTDQGGPLKLKSRPELCAVYPESTRMLAQIQSFSRLAMKLHRIIFAGLVTSLG